MKLNIMQITLGLGIIIAMALSITWDSWRFYVRLPFGESTDWQTIFNPDTREVIATILAFLVLLLGLAIIGVSIALLTAKVRSKYTEPNSEIETRVKRLVIAQIVLGLLLAISTLLIVIWGFPTSYDYTLSDNIKRSVMFMPPPRFVWAQGLSLLTFIIGIVLLGCNIAQLRSVRLSRASSDDTECEDNLKV
jgi:hypothetical protein